MSDDLNSALRGLANKWARRAQESARDSKAGGDADPEKIAYQRGVAEGYYKAATELAELIKTLPVTPPRPSASAPSGSQEVKPNPNAGGRWGTTNAPAASGPPSLTPTPAAPPPAPAVPTPPPTPPAGRPAPPAAAAPQWLAMEISEVLSMLQYSGTTPRDIIPRPDNTFLAIFSRWENLTPPQRQAQVQKADHRLVIVETGMTKDTRDPYIIIAFKP